MPHINGRPHHDLAVPAPARATNRAAGGVQGADQDVRLAPAGLQAGCLPGILAGTGIVFKIGKLNFGNEQVVLCLALVVGDVRQGLFEAFYGIPVFAIAEQIVVLAYKAR